MKSRASRKSIATARSARRRRSRRAGARAGLVQGRREDPQLRADARVPRGRVLRRATSAGKLTGIAARFARVVGEHEQAHVDALKQALGSKAVKSPSFDFKGTTADQDTFAKTAIVLDDAGVEAYQGQAPNIRTPAVLQAAIAIHPVEPRHAAWIRSIVGNGGDPSPAAAAFNPAKDMDAILAAVRGTGFITMRKAESGNAVSAQPSMTG